MMNVTLNDKKVLCFGECMIEVQAATQNIEKGGGTCGLSFGGDTLNTAVSLARLGLSTTYFTALGQDLQSQHMLDAWQLEGIDTSLVARIQGFLPGLYMIQLDAKNERSFLYWRKNSAATHLLESHTSTSLAAVFKCFSHLVISGITLSIYSTEDREKIYGAAALFRAEGGKVYFDSNIRLNGWNSAQECKETLERFYGLTDVSLPSEDDESKLFGDESAEDIAKRHRAYGIKETVVKRGAQGQFVFEEGHATEFKTEQVLQAVDTTGCGDAFNAGYIAARINGKPIKEAVLWGDKLARITLTFPGAIVKKHDFLKLWLEC